MDPADSGEKLSALIEATVESIQEDTKCKRADQMRNVIEFHLLTWLGEMENLNPLYKVSELIQVGSFAEGTKIIQPDEFDFLVVIDELSKPGSVIIDRNASYLENNLARVTISEDRLKTRWSNLCEDGHLKCFRSVNFPLPWQQRFGHVFIAVLWAIVKKGKRIGPTTGSPTDIACKIQLKTIDNITLFLEGAEFHMPNVLVKFLLGNIEITVDLSPAIRYHNIEHCFKAEDCAGPPFAELVLARESLLLIGTDMHDYDFKVTVTEAEVKYIQSVMKREHKLVYIFLKYVENIFRSYAVSAFSSYMLKSICIHHDIKCEADKRTIAECLKAVTEDLAECTSQGYVISVVNKHLHLYPSILRNEVKEKRLYMIDAISGLVKKLNLYSTVEQFDVCLKDIIHQIEEKRYEEDRRRTQEMLQQSAGDRGVADGTGKSLVYKGLDAEAAAQVIFEMGFEPEQVRMAMSATGNDPDLAVEYLLKGPSKPVDGEEPSDKTKSSDIEQANELVKNPTNGQDISACEILYQRKRDM